MNCAGNLTMTGLAVDDLGERLWLGGNASSSTAISSRNRSTEVSSIGRLWEHILPSNGNLLPTMSNLRLKIK